MDAQLSSLSIVRLRNAAHFEFVTRFYSIINDYDTSNGMFQEAKAAFQRAIKKEEERITTFRSSEWTVVMREAVQLQSHCGLHQDLEQNRDHTLLRGCSRLETLYQTLRH